jgi:DNA-binding IclR family transcriptional regulator
MSPVAPLGDDPDSQGRSVLRRSAAIIEAFIDSECSLTLNQLSAKSGLPKSTVHRLADRLIEIGWLERTSGSYRIGLRLFEIGALADRRTRLIGSAGPHLQAVSKETGLAVQLGVLDHTDVVYLERIPMAGFQLPTRDGGRMPAYCTGLGKAMLAYAPSSDVSAVLERTLERLTPNTITEPAAFREELDLVRSAGFASDREEACIGVSCVSAPIRGSGRAIAALSVCGPKERVDARLSTVVRNAATQIWMDLFPSTARAN